MSQRNRVQSRVLLAIWLCGIGTVLSSALDSTLNRAIGQEPPNAGETTTAEKDVIREQTIYIPYEKLRKTFEKEGRGVFLPYEKFQELWNAARRTRNRPSRRNDRSMR